LNIQWYWWVFFGLSIGVIILDLVLELTGRRTLSQIVESLPIPNWVWYTLSAVGFVTLFFVVSPISAVVFLVAWLLGHFAQI
jgi:hypothetical protein